LAAIVVLTGCNSQQKQAEQHDSEMRQKVEQMKKKSNAYPVNGSETNHYIP
jgi:outer membrane biogenesis lipoprotein LolB